MPNDFGPFVAGDLLEGWVAVDDRVVIEQIVGDHDPGIGGFHDLGKQSKVELCADLVLVIRGSLVQNKIYLQINIFGQVLVCENLKLSTVPPKMGVR